MQSLSEKLALHIRDGIKMIQRVTLLWYGIIWLVLVGLSFVLPCTRGWSLTYAFLTFLITLFYLWQTLSIVSHPHQAQLLFLKEEFPIIWDLVQEKRRTNADPDFAHE